MSPPSVWTPLSMLAARFAANVTALAHRYPELAQQLRALTPSGEYHLSVAGGSIALGKRTAASPTIQPLPAILPAPAAAELAKRVFPTGACTEAIVVAGEDGGWLWNSLYSAKCNVLTMPAYRPPLFFLINNLERLWTILHVQQWTTLLADRRVRLFAGPNAFEQFRRSLDDELFVPWPRKLVSVGTDVWPANLPIDEVLATATTARQDRIAAFREQWDDSDPATIAARLAARFASDRPLKILGVTSRYTTFLQHSMRDWLRAFEQLGHQTRLIIESADHEIPSPLVMPSVCAEFKPDMVICIDHGRRSLATIPPDVPVVMWVQDRMPHIYSSETGQAQGRFDYTIGYSRGELTQQFGYPGSRFMPTMMAVNDDRFTTLPLSAAEKDRYACDVSFVTNCTRPAEAILREQIDQVGTPEVKRLFTEIYDRLVAIYAAGNAITSGDYLRQLIEQAMTDLRLKSDADQIMHIVQHGINNALFRHQAIRWVAEMDVNLHLYGNGWEQNPEFARYARGIADNQTQLPAIYRASAINLQVTPYGAVHQRLLDGLAAGGFFLLRGVVEDQLELLLRDLWHWCMARGVRDGQSMLDRRDAQLDRICQQFDQLSGAKLLSNPQYYFGGAEEVAMSNFTRTPNTLWERAERVTFTSREQLQAQVRNYLQHPQERAEIAAEMRQRVLETHTYRSLTRRLLQFIQRDLEPPSSAITAMAA